MIYSPTLARPKTTRGLYIDQQANICYYGLYKVRWGDTMPKMNKQQVFERVFGGDSNSEKDRLISELDTEQYNPFVMIRLSRAQIKTLSEYIALLPLREFRALALHYGLGRSHKYIAKLTGESRVNGLRIYCEDRLTQCMGLPRPIAARYWRYACSEALDIYPFPEDGS